jgi:hypothetical protein
MLSAPDIHPNLPLKGRAIAYGFGRLLSVAFAQRPVMFTRSRGGGEGSCRGDRQVARAIEEPDRCDEIAVRRIDGRPAGRPYRNLWALMN